MTDSTPKTRWYRLTPDRVVIVLLAIEGFMLLSERFEWFEINQSVDVAIMLTIVIVGLTLAITFLWFVISLLFRWRFQFSLLSLLLLVVAVAVPCAWIRGSQVKHQNEALAEKEAMTHIAAAGGRAECSSGSVLFEWIWVDGICFDHGRLSDDELANVLPYLKRLRELGRLNFYETAITDASVERLAAEMRRSHELRHLVDLDFDRTQVTDAGLKHLDGLTRLEGLGLTDTRITDAGLESLAGLGRLRSLSLDDTQITDVGLEHLKGLTHLEWLNLERTKVTDRGLRKLQQALPKCQIQH
jgi:Leucine-rich repeat (LRR) protein